MKLEEVEVEAGVERMILLEESTAVKIEGNEVEAEVEVEVMIEQDERVTETVDHVKKIVLTSVEEKIHVMIEEEKENQGAIGGKNPALQIDTKGIGILTDVGKMIGEKVAAQEAIKGIDSNPQRGIKGKGILAVDIIALRKEEIHLSTGSYLIFVSVLFRKRLEMVDILKKKV